MITISVLIKAYLLGLFILALFFIVGWGIARICNHNRFASKPFYEYMLTGLFFTVSAYAIWRTHGATSLLPVPLLVLAWNLTHRKEFGVEIVGISKAQFLLVGAALTLYFLYYSQAFVSFDPEKIKYVTGDTLYYSRVSEYLNITGIEHNRLNYLFSERFGPQPYHYGDIWLGALVHKLSGMHPAIATMLIAYPVLAAIIVSGTYSYLRSIGQGRNAGVAYAIAIFVCLFSGFAIFFPTFLLKVDIFALSVGYYPKTLLICCIFIALLIAWRQGQWNKAIYLTTAGGLMFINAFPPLLLSLVFMLFIGVFVRKKIRFSSLTPGATISFLSLLYLYFFYSNGQASAAKTFQIPELSLIRTLINIFIGGLFQYSVLLPYFLILIVACLKGKGNGGLKQLGADMWFLIIFPLSGLLSWSLLFSVTSEAVQFFHNVLIPFSAIFIAAVSLWAIQEFKNRIWQTTVVSLLFVTIISNYKYDFHVGSTSRSEFKVSGSFVNKYGQGRIVNIQNESGFSTIFGKNTVVFQPLQFMSYIIERYDNMSLNIPFVPVTVEGMYKNVEEEIVNGAPFTYYVRQQPAGLSSEEMMYQFIRNHHVKYISVAPDASLSSKLTQIVTDSTKLPQSGWVLYKVD